MPKKSRENKFGTTKQYKEYRKAEVEMCTCRLCVYSNNQLNSLECVFCRKNMAANEYFIAEVSSS